MHLSIKWDMTIDACFDNGVAIKIKGEDVNNNESFYSLSTSHGSGATSVTYFPDHIGKKQALLVLFTGRKLP